MKKTLLSIVSLLAIGGVAVVNAGFATFALVTGTTDVVASSDGIGDTM